MPLRVLGRHYPNHQAEVILLFHIHLVPGYFSMLRQCIKLNTVDKMEKYKSFSETINHGSLDMVYYPNTTPICRGTSLKTYRGGDE